VQEAEAIEIGCDNCGATWLHAALAGWLHTCPYCGADDLNFGSNELAEQSPSASSYGRDLRGIARQLWRGAIDFDQAYGLFVDTIRLGLTKAWNEGANSCGIAPSELSPAERSELASAIAMEQGHIIGLLDFIGQNSKKNKVKLGVVLARVSLWELRYIDVVNRARLMACGDQRLEWVVGNIKTHCDSCIKLSGKVKRASYWEREGIHPQQPENDKLICKGWNCKCELVATDKPLSRGPLPRLP
jgi:hypothetical protein